MTPGTGDAAQRALEALQTNLTTRAISTRMDSESLAILTPGGDQVDTITVHPWGIDGDYPWFFDCMGHAVAEAHDVVGASVVIVGNMARGGHRV